MMKNALLLAAFAGASLIPSHALTLSDPGQGLFSLSSGSTGAAELSGITYAGSGTYYAVGDNGAKSLWTLNIGLNSATGIISSASVTGSISVSGLGTDSEGVSYRASSNSVFVSDEVASTIKEFRLSDGVQISTVTVPSIFSPSNLQGNFGLESLSYGGGTLWTANEEALSPDGSLSTTSQGSWVRLQRFNSSLLADGQWAYRTDAISAMSPLTTAERSGVVDVLPWDSRRILVLEREFGGSFIPDFRSRLYLVDVSAATDVSGLAELDGGGFTALAKTLLWQDDFSATNFEGMTLGPTLDDGSRSLLLVSDDGSGSGGQTQSLYALNLTGDPSPTAAGYTWNGSLAAGTYSFDEAANWSPGSGPPGTATGDTVAFNSGTASYVINSAGSPSGILRSVNVAKSTGTVTWNITGDIEVQDASASDFSTFDTGTTTNIGSGGSLTFNSGMLGTVRVIRGGDLNVNDGGLLTVSAATGFVIGSTGGTSTLDVASGGSLVVKSGLFRIGFVANETAAGVLTSNGTVTSGFGLRVGERTGSGTATGTVTVNGGTFTVNASSTFGVSAGTTATLNVSGGTYRQAANSALTIGSSGTGILNISAGTLLVDSGTAAGQGRLTLGAGSTYNQTGGSVTVRELVSISAATRTFAAGTLEITSSLNPSNGSVFVVGDGTGSPATLRLANATTALSDGLRIASDGILEGANSASTRGAVEMFGTLRPGGGSSTGTFDLATTTTLAATSILEFEIAGLSSLDRWISSDALTFDGTLKLTLLGGFNPSPGDSFDLFDFSSATGSFATLDLAPLDPGLFWDTSALATTGTLSVIPEPSTMALAVTALAAVLVFRRRRVPARMRS